MNSLEFIEKEIATTKSKYKERIKYNQTSFAIKDEKKLKILQQIKNKLEAWEETQKYLILNEGCLPFYGSTYEYLTLKNDCIDESNSEEEGISLTIIKKALEEKE